MGQELLTWETLRRVELLFHGPERGVVQEILIRECGNNLPFLEKSTPEQLERFRFAALKMSNGDIQALRKAVGVAKVDWRDLLVAAGFAHDVRAHEQWIPTAR